MMEDLWKDLHSALGLHKCDYCTQQKLQGGECKPFSAMLTLKNTSFTTKGGGGLVE